MSNAATLVGPAAGESLATVDRLPLWRAAPICLALFLIIFADLAVQRLFFGASVSPHDLPQLWQIPSTTQMRSLPFQSIWFWHAYPSGFVAYWTLLVNLLGEHGSRLACGWIYLTGSALLAPMVYVITLALCGRRTVSVAAALVLGFSPTLPLFAAYYIYDAPTMILVTAVTACVALYQLKNRNPAYLVAGLWLAGCMVIIRAFYHIGIMVPLLAGILVARPNRKIIASALAALVPPLLLYGKNLALFGLFGSSSMLGFNMSKVVIYPLPPKAITQLRHAGTIPPLVADYPLFYPLVHGRAIYTRRGFTAVGTSDIDNQDDVNNINLIAVSHLYGQASKAVLRNNPLPYLRSIADAYQKFCGPPSRSFWFDHNPARIRVYRAVYLNLFYGEWLSKAVRKLTGWYKMPWLVMAALPLLIGAFAAGQIAHARLSWRRWANAASSNVTLYATIGFLIYTTIMACLLELNENDRYFTYIEPLFVASVAAGLYQLWRWIDRRRGGRRVKCVAG